MSNSKKRLIIVSNRLPVTVKKTGGKLSFEPSSGGLATAMSTLKVNHEKLWVGWPGIASDELTAKDKLTIKAKLRADGFLPVFLTQAEVDDFYSGYCNSKLWPMFHYFTQHVVNDSSHWQAYQQVNQKFAEATLKNASKISDIWVQDYQLMLLPAMIRQKLDDVNIGFFLHTPFPSYEVFRLLPERNELLNGLLGADLVGFHTYDYVRHFLSSVLRNTGNESNLGVITVASSGRKVITDAFPIGIEYKKFASASLNAAKIKPEFLKNLDPDTKVILSVDRTDYSKGILERLDAFEEFLNSNNKLHRRVVMIMVAVPSREDVDAYQELREEIEKKVSRINGQFSTVDWTPITYIHNSVEFKDLVSLYRRADVMLVTPLRDGMNLVAKEFVACKQGTGGVLILSEMAGAASELIEALLVNPSDKHAVADAIIKAIEMPVEQQNKRLRLMKSRISSYTVDRWAEDFIGQLTLSATRKHGDEKLLIPSKKRKLQKSYTKAKKRLILLDYDGTLAGFVADPNSDEVKPTPKVKQILRTLASDERNQVYIISGRPKQIMHKWFKGQNVNLIAEHGAWVKKNARWSSVSVKDSWKRHLKPILEYFADRTPGALVEEKDFALVWHYRSVSPDLAYVRRKELLNELRNVTKGLDVETFEGSKIIEIKPLDINKGGATSKILNGTDWDFIMAIGDDYTDEDTFKALPGNAHTIKVGEGQTAASMRVPGVKAVVELLELLSKPGGRLTPSKNKVYKTAKKYYRKYSN